MPSDLPDDGWKDRLLHPRSDRDFFNDTYKGPFFTGFSSWFLLQSWKGWRWTSKKLDKDSIAAKIVSFIGKTLWVVVLLLSLSFITIQIPLQLGILLPFNIISLNDVNIVLIIVFMAIIFLIVSPILLSFALTGQVTSPLQPFIDSFSYPLMRTEYNAGWMSNPLDPKWVSVPILSSYSSEHVGSPNANDTKWDLLWKLAETERLEGTVWKKINEQTFSDIERLCSNSEYALRLKWAFNPLPERDDLRDECREWFLQKLIDFDGLLDGDADQVELQNKLQESAEENLAWDFIESCILKNPTEKQNIRVAFEERLTVMANKANQ